MLYAKFFRENIKEIDKNILHLLEEMFLKGPFYEHFAEIMKDTIQKVDKEK